MKEEFESARKWVEENEVCRFEGNMQDMEKSHSFINCIYNYMFDREETLRHKTFNVVTHIIMDFHRHAGFSIKGFENMIIWGEKESDYKALASRAIKKEEEKEYQDFLNYLNECVNDDNRLKQLYKDFIYKLNIPPVKLCIGGFDLIDVMRRSKHKILYNIEPIDNEHSYFSVIVTVNELNR